MWRLLPLCLLVACVATEPRKSNPGEGARAAPTRVVRVMDLPLQPPRVIVEGEPVRWTFRDFNVSGWLDENGDWHVRSEVSHGRIRCAAYEVGVQLGKGLPACSNFQRLNGVAWATRVRHCNSATRIHSGGGSFADTKAVEAATCARVVVRCEGC